MKDLFGAAIELAAAARAEYLNHNATQSQDTTAIRTTRLKEVLVRLIQLDDEWNKPAEAAE